VLDDLHRRDSFRESQAEFIPSDLWPGLVNAPTRFKVVREDSDGRDDGDGIPEVGRSVFERAVKRVREKAKPFRRGA
jgi:autophagy-related protein 17